MKQEITFTAIFNGKPFTARLHHQFWVHKGYELTVGKKVIGHFSYVEMRGWVYHGYPLELDDIQILLDIIFIANGWQNYECGLKYQEHIVIPQCLMRHIYKFEDREIAIRLSFEYSKNKEIWEGGSLWFKEYFKGPR